MSSMRSWSPWALVVSHASQPARTRAEPIHTVCATKIKFPACLGSRQQIGDTARCSSRSTAEAMRGLLAVVHHLGTGRTGPPLGDLRTEGSGGGRRTSRPVRRAQYVGIRPIMKTDELGP